MKIDLKHLLQIDALCRHRNFGRAAKELNITQPGLSQSIRHLEHLLGFQLFDRNSREISPTVFGKRVLETGRIMLRDSELLERDLGMLSQLQSGTIRVGVGPLAADVFLGKTLGDLIADHPQFHVRTVVDWVPSLLDLLLCGDLDVVIGDSRFIDDTESFRIKSLPRHSACFVCHPKHPLVKKVNPLFRDIFNYPIATPQLPELVVKELARMSDLDFKTMEEFPNGLIEAPYNLLAEALSRCDGVGIGIKPVFSRELTDGRLTILPLPEHSLQTSYEIISLKKYSQSPAVTLFSEYVARICKQYAMKE